MTVPDPGPSGFDAMGVALAEAERVRGSTAPNPWVGAVVWDSRGEIARGATSPPGGPHAEVVALEAAGDRSKGATLSVTLEPCAHHGRTAPCVDAIVRAGVARVVVGLEDPDSLVHGRGIAALRAAGVDVTVGSRGRDVAEQLAPYVKHRTTGRPWVVLKLAVTMDGSIAAPDGSSQWITGPEARRDAHRLRAISDAILVGAGTVRRDDPSLTVRPDSPDTPDTPDTSDTSDTSESGGAARDRAPAQPLRVVLGTIPPAARVEPALAMSGDLETVLDDLGQKGVLQLLVEGGATVARDFHRFRLVDRYVFYVAPAFFGGDDARPVFAGAGVASVAELVRGRFVSVERLGDDLRVEVEAP